MLISIFISERFKSRRMIEAGMEYKTPAASIDEVDTRNGYEYICGSVPCGVGV